MVFKTVWKAEEEKICTPTFLHQMRDVMKIHIRGKFHQYDICGCQVTNFQNFAYQINNYVRPIFWGRKGGVVGLYPFTS